MLSRFDRLRWDISKKFWKPIGNCNGKIDGYYFGWIGYILNMDHEIVLCTKCHRPTPVYRDSSGGTKCFWCNNWDNEV